MCQNAACLSRVASVATPLQVLRSRTSALDLLTYEVMEPSLRALAIVTAVLVVSTSARAESEMRIGDAACRSCHPQIAEPFAKTVHGVLLDSGQRAGLEAARCESCHGSGEAHVAAAGGKVPAGAGPSGWRDFKGAGGAARENETCLGCHQGGGQTHWSSSVHARGEGRCSNCHDVHREVSKDHLLARRSEAELCSSCHLLPRSQMRKSAHMPARSGAVGDGFMTCSTCHQPHGTPTKGLLSAHTVNDSCTSCHAEKRGPFLNEHAPVREDCLNCHDPHGSLNRGMLKVAGPRLCQSCHTATLHPSNARGSNARMVIGRNCLQCHQKIHGSNHPSGSAFTR